MNEIKLIAFPNPILTTKALPVLPEEMGYMKEVATKMLSITSHNGGIGLAGPQANISKRIIVLKHNGQDIVMINPEIVEKSGKNSIEEGCLSLRGIRIKINRSAQLTVKYLNLDGEEKVTEASGVFAICIEHEIDHLDGILFTDRSGPMKDLWLKRYFKGRK